MNGKSYGIMKKVHALEGYMSHQILVCDDDREIVEAIGIYLMQEGFQVLKAYDGAEALSILRLHSVQLVILDIMMPKLDGLMTTIRIREQWNVPVILLTAKSEDVDKITGLTFGADDYVTKPFQPLELMARVKSQLRRYTRLGSQQQSPQLLTTGGLALSMDSKELTVDGENVRITPTEFGILSLLMQHPGKVFSMEQIYQHVWDEPAFAVENTVAVHVRRIREKIEINPKNPKYIKVVWGIGYKMEKL